MPRRKVASRLVSVCTRVDLEIRRELEVFALELDEELGHVVTLSEATRVVVERWAAERRASLPSSRRPERTRGGAWRSTHAAGDQMKVAGMNPHPRPDRGPAEAVSVPELARRAV